MRNTYILICLLVSFLVSSQEAGKASWNYTQQSDLDNFANQRHESINNSLILTTLCESDFPTLLANETLEISCVYDLKGETITIPEGATLAFFGGDIFNGILNFSSTGKIAGELLNSKLEVEGDVKLISEFFEFIPSRWEDDIVEGEITSDIALKNNSELENLMFFTKSLGATTFIIDEFDAYFEVGKVTSTTTNQNFYPSVEAVNIPSDFHLKMTDNTHLRVFPNDAPKYSLIGIRDVANVTITGGNLYGDREEHIFTDGGTHEWGHCLELHAATYTEISGVKMSNGNGDGMKIHSINFSYLDSYLPSHSILVIDCVFDSNRRNNLSITDGHDIIVEKSVFLNAGIDTNTSTGIAPKFGIDIEAHRERDESTGEIVYYERAKDITIRNNVEKGSQAVGFGIYIGENVTIEDNDIETSISWSWTENSIVRNNIITANPNRDVATAIIAGRSDNKATTFNNEIYGNTITGYGSGITVYGRENKVYNNTIEECVQGIFPRYLEDSEIYENSITSTLESSKGIFGNSTTINNVDFYNNTVTVTADAYRFVTVNNEVEASEYTFTIRENNFIQSAESTISNTKGLTLRDNEINANTALSNTSKISITGNAISSTSSTGIHLKEVNEDVEITDNIISVKTNGECVKIDTTTDLNEVTTSNNNCSNE